MFKLIIHRNEMTSRLMSGATLLATFNYTEEKFLLQFQEMGYGAKSLINNITNDISDIVLDEKTDRCSFSLGYNDFRDIPYLVLTESNTY